MNWYPTARCLALAEVQLNRMVDRTGGAPRAEPQERAPCAEARPAGLIRSEWYGDRYACGCTWSEDGGPGLWEPCEAAKAAGLEHCAIHREGL